MSYGSMQHSLFLAHGVKPLQNPRALILSSEAPAPTHSGLGSSLQYSLHLTSRWGKRGSGGRQEGYYYRQCLASASLFHILLSGTQTALEGRNLIQWWHNRKGRGIKLKWTVSQSLPQHAYNNKSLKSTNIQVQFDFNFLLNGSYGFEIDA